MAYAHYFKAKTGNHIIISNDTRPVGKTVLVKGKPEARKIAKEMGAKPWNF